MNNKKIKNIFLTVLVLSLIIVFNVNAEGFSNGTFYCGDTELPVALKNIVRIAILAIKIFVPVILVIMGMIDFGRAALANEEKDAKASLPRFIRRSIAAVAIFFIVSIVQFIFGMVDDKSVGSCFGCLLGNTDLCLGINRVTTSEKVKTTVDDCELRYTVVLPNNSDKFTINFSSNCYISNIKNTTCFYEDDNGGNNITGNCELEQHGNSFTGGANYTSSEISYKVIFGNGKETTVEFTGIPEQW